MCVCVGGGGECGSAQLPTRGCWLWRATRIGEDVGALVQSLVSELIPPVPPPVPPPPGPPLQPLFTPQVCAQRFSMARRKHHCRACGRLVCNDCSPSSARRCVPEFNYFEPVRLCVDCVVLQ